MATTYAIVRQSDLATINLIPPALASHSTEQRVSDTEDADAGDADVEDLDPEFAREISMAKSADLL